MGRTWWLWGGLAFAACGGNVSLIGNVSDGGTNGGGGSTTSGTGGPLITGGTTGTTGTAGATGTGGTGTAGTMDTGATGAGAAGDGAGAGSDEVYLGPGMDAGSLAVGGPRRAPGDAGPGGPGAGASGATANDAGSAVPTEVGTTKALDPTMPTFDAAPDSPYFPGNPASYGDVSLLGATQCGGALYPATGFYGDNILAPGYTTVALNAKTELSAKLGANATVKIKMTLISGQVWLVEATQTDWRETVWDSSTGEQQFLTSDSGRTLEAQVFFQGSGRALIEYFECGATTPTGSKLLLWGSGR